jgi:hypothetical protein
MVNGGAGVVYASFDPNGAWKLKVTNELQSAGYEIRMAAYSNKPRTGRNLASCSGGLVTGICGEHDWIGSLDPRADLLNILDMMPRPAAGFEIAGRYRGGYHHAPGPSHTDCAWRAGRV